jgi:hypothetical protein
MLDIYVYTISNGILPSYSIKRDNGLFKRMMRYLWCCYMGLERLRTPGA